MYSKDDLNMILNRKVIKVRCENRILVLHPKVIHSMPSVFTSVGYSKAKMLADMLPIGNP